MRTLQVVRVTKAEHDEVGDLGNHCKVKVTPGQPGKQGNSSSDVKVKETQKRTTC